MNNKEAISVIRNNWPPANYTMLIEALELSIKVLEDSEASAKGFVDFIKHYKLEYDCDPDSLTVWNAATLFIIEKLKAHNQEEKSNLVMSKTVEQLEKERRLDVCANCDTDRSKCKYECGEENHWSARHSFIEEEAKLRSTEQKLRDGIASISDELGFDIKSGCACTPNAHIYRDRLQKLLVQ